MLLIFLFRSGVSCVQNVSLSEVDIAVASIKTTKRIQSQIGVNHSIKRTIAFSKFDLVIEETPTYRVLCVRSGQLIVDRHSITEVN